MSTSSANATPTLVTVVGDSLSLPRHFAGVGFSVTYPYLLASWLREQGQGAEVWTCSWAGATVAELESRFNDHLTYAGAPRGSIVLVHLGIVDCTPRPIPLAARRVVGRLPGPLRRAAIRFLHRFRVSFIRYGPGFVFTPEPAFAKRYDALLRQAAKGSDRVFAINIAPPGPGFESRSPGVGRSVERYNRIIADVVSGMGNAELVDLYAVCRQEEGLASPDDGHHLTLRGHAAVLDLITRGRATDELLGKQAGEMRA